MATQSQDIKVKKGETAPSSTAPRSPSTQSALSPFEDMERWFSHFFNHNWMHPFSGDWSPFNRDWNLPQHWPSMPQMQSTFDVWKPRVDMLEHDNDYLIKAELPGVKKGDIDISVTNHTVTIQARLSREEKHEEGDYFQREISRGEIYRTLRVPTEVDCDNAKAKFKDGMLELTLPKLESSQRKSIKVD